VYVEEIPSGVHTITQVSTSITAFLGFTQRGPVDRAVHIFSFADFERAFGGVTVDSPLSHAVRHFFQNGGAEGYVVRVAVGAQSASVKLRNDTTDVLEVRASSEGTWGNNLRLTVDYDTAAPDSLFNLIVTELIDRGNQLVTGRVETFRNLSMDSHHPAYVVTTVNNKSDLVTCSLPQPRFTFGGTGSSESGILTKAPTMNPGYRVAYTLNGTGPFEVTITAAPPTGTTLEQALPTIAKDIAAAINAQQHPSAVTGTASAGRLEFTANVDGSHPPEQSSIRFLDASVNSATATLKLGTANGGVETDAAAAFRPQPTGTIGTLAGLSEVRLRNNTTDVLIVKAPWEGTGRNNLQLKVDYDTDPPGSLFNLTVTDLTDRDNPEIFRNLSMDSHHPHYVETVVNEGSELVTVTRPDDLGFSGKGSSRGGEFTTAPTANPGYRVAYTLNGTEQFEVTITSPTTPKSSSVQDALEAIAHDIAAAINAQQHWDAVTGTVSDGRLNFTANTDGSHPPEQSSIHFFDASADSATATLKLGTAHGGEETDAAAAYRPQKTGPTPAELAVPAAGSLTINIYIGPGPNPVRPGLVVDVWGGKATRTPPGDLAQLAQLLDAALAETARQEPLLTGAHAKLAGGLLYIIPGGTDGNVSIAIASPTGFTLNDLKCNVGAYAPGSGQTALAQSAGTGANNGTPPTSPETLAGDEPTKKGMYALEDVDLFNLLVMPDASTGEGKLLSAFIDAIAYCTKRRAFVLIDIPETQQTFAKAETWLATPEASALRSRNSALFFPRLRMPDPASGIVTAYSAAGAIAGLYARTDAERGVWKAPAGTGAALIGATGLSYKLTDKENGTLNQLGLNCLRVFPVVGSVCWGARTGKGADTLADEYKYVPVRRLALMIEETFYRGTQWVVFEPNDEPLWAQIRLNLGAAMHTLFAQGAFQGRTPREAYFVKCDKETTTQNDIDLGRVNIVVGFAPLKPAEFVIIQIQQIAGAIQT